MRRTEALRIRRFQADGVFPYTTGRRMASAIQIERLTRRFSGSDRPAVDDVSLSVASGEIVSLVGPSGCGKSTTLRMVAGLDLPDQGSVKIGGREMRGVPPQDRDVAMVFQGFALYPHMTVREIIGFPLRMRGVGASERAERVRETAELLSITPLLDRRPGALSGGEQQRVAMGRAIVRKPAVFLFDEPLSNLDAALRAELRIELGKLLRRIEATALYVTHDQVEAMTLSDRIAVLRRGKLEQLGTPREIYESPASTFVAGFFGSPPMNLLKAVCADGKAKVGDLVVNAPDGAPDHVVLGIRPEHIRVGAESDAHARVVAVEPLGGETHLELELDGQTLRAKVAGFDAPAPNERVPFAVDGARLAFFDPESEKAL
jgi:sn-glycerol 3-phosphate transport system ATP-binding protein